MLPAKFLSALIRLIASGLSMTLKHSKSKERIQKKLDKEQLRVKRGGRVPKRELVFSCLVLSSASLSIRRQTGYAKDGIEVFLGGLKSIRLLVFFVSSWYVRKQLVLVRLLRPLAAW
jgi:hypothetical protein